ncbi:MAG TPA: Crp/Fnr family transcriptional regulator [Acidimicrobiales bacterium]|nr:Crp/Fnr family transcriptional regulator [Acidimicrobiales bacterium]
MVTIGAKGRAQLGNRLLDSLPLPDRRRVAALLEREKGEHKQMLYDHGACIEALHFPVDAVASILTTLSDGAGVEIATVGNEGMLGSLVLLGSDAMPTRTFCQIQVPGEMLRMERASFVEALSSNDSFRNVVQLYVQAFFSQIAQQVACNALHSVEERCCRWLLLTHDRVHKDTFPITHEFLAQMLGVRRASVTLAAGALQAAGLISYRRGEMVILDREGLEDASCECYQLLRDEFDRLLGPTKAKGTADDPPPSRTVRRRPAKSPSRARAQG